MSERTAVLVVTHGEAGTAMLAEATRLLGAPAVAGVEALGVAAGESRDEIRARMAAAVRRLDAGRGVLVLVDLQGSTPCNCAVQIKKDGANAEILCGVSLPMLVKVAASDREHLTPHELAHEAAQTAIRSVRLGDGGTP
jgi:mannose/fructose-specific phosphotransferase system component IIA